VFEKTARIGTVEQIVRKGRKVDVLALSVNKRHYADLARNHEVTRSLLQKNVCNLDPATILSLPLSLLTFQYVSDSYYKTLESSSFQPALHHHHLHHHQQENSVATVAMLYEPGLAACNAT
jgi:hypothetical protein